MHECNHQINRHQRRSLSLAILLATEAIRQAASKEFPFRVLQAPMRRNE